MRDVAIVGFHQLPHERRTALSEVELVRAVVEGALDDATIDRRAIDFWCSGSADMLVGRPFSFVSALDAIGAWPPVAESHVEMDGAWALYEAWVRLLHGDFHTSLVYCFGEASVGDLRKVLVTQLDPYYVAPLGVDSISVAALQAQALLDTGRYTERDFAEVAHRSREAARNNPNAYLKGSPSVDTLLEESPIVGPLRKHACPPITDGACAMVLATREYVEANNIQNVAWIRGFDHRVDAHDLGARDLADAPSARIAAEKAGASSAPIDVAELHAPFAHQELILRDAMGVSPQTAVNPSGGALAANSMMVAGLVRIGEAANAVREGRAKRALAHATSGPALQQNLVCIVEAN